MHPELVVAIINEPREIDKIRRRFLEQLASCDNVVERHSENIPSSKGLHCEIFSFESEKGFLSSPEKIYDSFELKRDQTLLTGKSEMFYINYAQRLIGS